MAADVSDFYRVLAEVAEKGFTPEQKQREEHLALIERHLRAIRSPVQVFATAEMLARLRLPTPHLERLLTGFAEALTKVVADDRALDSHGYSNARQGLANLAQAARACAPCDKALLTAWRKFLMAQLSGARCADTVFDRNGQPLPLHGLAKDFNNLLNLTQLEIAPLTLEDLKPLKVLERRQVHDHWKTTQGRAALLGLKELRFGPMAQQLENQKQGIQSKPYSLEQRQSLEWNRRLNDFLAELDRWKPEHEPTEADYFHQKCIAYMALAELLPPGVLRERLLGEYVGFLKLNRFQRDNRLEWFLQVNNALTHTGSDKATLLEQFKASGDSVLQLLAKLEPLFSEAKQRNL